MTLQGQFQAIYNILLVVTVISLATRRFRFSSSLAFIVAGVMSTAWTSFPLPSLSPEIFTSLLLPPIVFQETLRLNIDDLISESKSVLAYAVLGTLLMLMAVGLFLHLFLGFSPVEALLLGVIIAPTDPVAVINVFHEIGVVKRFQLIVCGEALLNDGIAIALYSIIVSLITMGSITVMYGAKITLVSILGGVLLGVIFSYAAHILFCWTDEKFTEVLISFLVAFGVFWISESINASGVIATVTTGLIINYRTHAYGGMGKQSFEALETMWEFVGFAASSIAFIFIGANLNISVLFSNLYPILYLFAFILLSRHTMVYALAELVERLGGRAIPGTWRLGLSWSGLRGAVSVVLALGMSSLALPHSEVIVALTFGVVLTSNVIQGLSISEVMKRSGLSAVGDLEEVMEGRTAPPVMREGYSSSEFKKGRSLWEKLIFSAPEYFVFDTRLGIWILLRLQHTLEFINVYIARMPKTEGGLLRRGFEVSADLITHTLNQMTQARRNYYMDMVNDAGVNSDVPLDSLYEMRRRQVNTVFNAAGGTRKLRDRGRKRSQDSD